MSWYHFIREPDIIHCMYELFEHTADLGLRIRASDLNGLFAEAAECLFTAVLEDVGNVKPLVAVTIEIAGTDRDFQLFDWLRELLMRCDEDHLVFGKFEVKARDDGLTGTAWGEQLDSNRHQLAHEVKAITYHGLKVEQTADGWLAEVIVDI
jgi:SHS2 domain-containing protein